MTQRERVLAILVAGLLIGGGIWWGLGKYQAAVKKRTATKSNMTVQRDAGFDVQLQGAMADRQMGYYVERSLPSNPNVASRQYAGWLLDAAERHGLKDASVDPQSVQAKDDLYNQLSFQVQGNTDMDSFVDWMHEFYAKDYLHRIRTWTLRPNRGGGFRLDMTIDALSISGRSDDLPIPTQPSYRVAGDVDSYRETILNRNFFEPPNNAPRFTGKSTVDVEVGKSSTTPLTFEDAEKHPLEFAIVTAPENVDVTLDARSGNLRIQGSNEGEFEVEVMATDSGYPARSTQQTLVVKVRPPKEMPKPVVPLKFDDAKQTVLTALVQGEEKYAWLNVRTRGQTLKLRVGDSFEVGSVKGTVTAMDSREATIEVGGKSFQLKLKDNLKEIVGDVEAEEEASEKEGDDSEEENVAETETAEKAEAAAEIDAEASGSAG